MLLPLLVPIPHQRQEPQTDIIDDETSLALARLDQSGLIDSRVQDFEEAALDED